MRVLCRSLEDKKLVWFEKSNKYVQMEEPAYEVFKRLEKSEPADAIALWCSQTYRLTLPESHKFVDEVWYFIHSNSKPTKSESPLTHIGADQIPTREEIFSIKYYHFAGSDFCFQYSHQRIERMIHPLVAHLQVKKPDLACHQFQLFRRADFLYLRNNKKLIGQWSLSEEHFFKGKVFLELLNKAYQKEEGDWMAVMHGSAISDGKHCIILTGDSGKGKSTTLALLLANGFKFMTDDFVPIEGVSGEVYPFPTAISVKKGAMEVLQTVFPKLLEAEEFYFKEFDKTVRYLSPHFSKELSLQSLPVKAIVFVNFEPGVGLEISRKPNTEAIQNLITESWLSPRYENAERFLDWAISMPYFQLRYSDNQQMIAAITKLFRTGIEDISDTSK